MLEHDNGKLCDEQGWDACTSGSVFLTASQLNLNENIENFLEKIRSFVLVFNIKPGHLTPALS